MTNPKTKELIGADRANLNGETHRMKLKNAALKADILDAVDAVMMEFTCTDWKAFSADKLRWALREGVITPEEIGAHVTEYMKNFTADPY